METCILCYVAFAEKIRANMYVLGYPQLHSSDQFDYYECLCITFGVVLSMQFVIFFIVSVSLVFNTV